MTALSYPNTEEAQRYLLGGKRQTTRSMQKKALQAVVRRAFHLRDRGLSESKRSWDSLLRPCLSCADAVKSEVGVRSPGARVTGN